MSREADLYKDKIEVSLDGRQIFYLFFGGAVIVGLVFVLGVMVGRRVEARGHVDRARTTAAVDPLAALDRLEDNGGLSFKGALMGAKKTEPSQDDVEHAIGVIEKQRKGEVVKVDKPADKPIDKQIDKQTDKQTDKAKVDDKKPEAKAEAKVEDKKPEAKAEDKKLEDKKLETKKPEAKLEDKKPEAKLEDKKPEAKLEDKKPEDKKLEHKAEDKKAEAKPEAKVADKKSEEPKSKYTLQLSSFQERSEADTFLATLKAQGYSASVTEATVDGKKFFRVRMGSYKSLEAANDAKAELERTAKKSSSVMKL